MNSAQIIRSGILLVVLGCLLAVWWPAIRTVLETTSSRSELDWKLEQLAESHRAEIDLEGLNLVLLEGEDEPIVAPLCDELRALAPGVICQMRLSDTDVDGSGRRTIIYGLSIAGPLPLLDRVLDKVREVPGRTVESWLLQHRGEGEASLSLEIVSIGLLGPQLALLEAQSDVGSWAEGVLAPEVRLARRNPFDPEHRAYRAPQPAPPPVAPPEISILGISLVSGERVALLVINGREIEVVQGDDTEAGVVSLIDTDAVEFLGETPRRVMLFE